MANLAPVHSAAVTQIIRKGMCALRVCTQGLGENLQVIYMGTYLCGYLPVSRVPTAGVCV